MARILLSAYACEPDRGSEPGVGWSWAIELARLGHRVWVLTRSDNRASIEREHLVGSPNLNFIYYDLPQWAQPLRRCRAGKMLYYVLWQWSAVRRLRKLFPELPFDAVQHVTYVSIRYPSFMGSLGVPFYLGPVSGGERVPPKLRKGLSIAERWREWLRDLSNFLVAVDPWSRRSFRQAQKIFVTRDTLSLVPRRWRHKCDIHLAIGLSSEYLDREAPTLRRRDHYFRIVYVGRILESKGSDIALCAIRQLREWGLNVRFTIVGDGPARSRLTRLAETLQLSGVVGWAGCIPHRVVEEYYGSADLFLFPSLCESGGMAVLEALAHGLPAVCTELGGPGAIVTWRCGRVLPVLEASREALATSFASAISEILTTPGLRDSLSASAHARAQEFDFQNLVRAVYPDSPVPAINFENEHPLQLVSLVPRGAAL